MILDLGVTIRQFYEKATNPKDFITWSDLQTIKEKDAYQNNFVIFFRFTNIRQPGNEPS